MSTTEHRLAANRANAQLSTGPTTPEGKAVASLNATRHGLLSARMFLEDDDPSEFQSLNADLCQALSPVGAMEAVLVDRIAVTVWRQRRLVRAEAASLTLARQTKKIAGGVSSELGRGYGSELKPDELAPFDAEREQWCRGVLAEIEALSSFELADIEKAAPLVWQQLSSDAAEDHQPVPKFIADHKGGIQGFIAELLVWCREQLRQAEGRPHILALADQVRAKRLVLPADALELLARYQTTLDNQMFKLLRALREAQEWRLKTPEVHSSHTADEEESTTNAGLAQAA